MPRFSCVEVEFVDFRVKYNGTLHFATAEPELQIFEWKCTNYLVTKISIYIYN